MLLVAYPTKLLNENEEVVLYLHPHWWYLAPHIAALVVTIALGIVVIANDVPDAARIAVGIVVLLSLAWFGARYARWVTTEFVVTTDRVINRSGFLAKSGIEIPLDRINTVFFHQTIFERLIGLGDLAIESASAEGRQQFSNIKKPNAVQTEIYRQIEGNQQRDRADIGRAASAGGGGGGGLSIPEQIEKLDELRARGALSDEEFQSKKAELLDRM